MSRPIAYGLDFGTSNSAISVAYPEESVLVPLGADGHDVLPSIVYLDASRQRLAGELAVQQYLVSGARHTTRLLSSMKSFLADPSWTDTLAPWGDQITPSELVAVLIRELKREADRYCREDVRRVVLGHPAFFIGAEGKGWKRRQELAKSRLEEAAVLAGFEEVVFADEALAAVAQDRSVTGIVVGLDFGGGTFDVSVVEQTARDRTLLATHGTSVGGERFDALLFEDALSESLGLLATYKHHGKKLGVPMRLKTIGTLHGMVGVIGDDQVRRIFDNFTSYSGGQRLSTLEEILYGGHGYTFFRRVESSKIALSTLPESEIRFHRPGIEVDQPVQRKRFESLIADDLDRVDDAVRRALADAGVGPEQVSVVVRTGGSSQIPAFIERVNRTFGRAKVEQRDALATVALGLGLISLDAFS